MARPLLKDPGAARADAARVAGTGNRGLG